MSSNSAEPVPERPVWHSRPRLCTRQVDDRSGKAQPRAAVPHIVLIGIDDTDNAESRGTGYLARQLLAHCAALGCRPIGVTRHQFLVDPRIPYTSHNSGACLAVETAGGVDSVRVAFDFVARASAEGSDPGVCIVALEDVPAAVIEFGRRATAEVLEIAEAMDLAAAAGIELRPLGGTGQGVIGALGSVGLRAGGNDGRFIEWPGLRQLPERVKSAELAEMGIGLDHRSDRRPGPDDIYETLGWLRPALVSGGPLWSVTWNEERNAWIPVDTKRSRPLE